MTTAPVVEPLTVRALLLGREERAPDALAETLHAHRAAAGVIPGGRGLTPAADRAVGIELATVVNGFLDLDLVTLVAAGWSRYQALTEAARRTHRHPGSEEVVALATHTITSAHHPSVDLLVDGAPTATVGVDLTVVFKITGLVAVVRDGLLVAVRSGQCAVEAKLAVRDIVVASRKGRLDLPATLRLREPVDLMPHRAAPPPPPRPPTPPPAPPPPPPVRWGHVDGQGDRR
ncbi:MULTISPECIES: hypothetical protein [unclassified Streptomyces]|uniref:hypothetical protein n=1 Tax=unclassified Streptomyces TaxID=2593676 RepID=UPI002E3537B2|nr:MULTISPECIES: hypothetical protein [unclassified Streptomyces]WUC67964.1 hypothetical protein OG861_29080 [Streptomyces sp. NBC_00539]